MMRWRDAWLLVLTVTGLAVGIGASLAGRDDVADIVWTVPTVIVAVRLAWSIVRDLLARKAGVDVIALLAIVGALALGETFAARGHRGHAGHRRGARDATRRDARQRELTALLGRAPQEVRRYRPDGALETVAIAEVAPGRPTARQPGEVVPVDGVVAGAAAVLDESALTGEAAAGHRATRRPVASGDRQRGGPFDLRATATAERQHLRRHRPSGRARRARQGAVRPPGRPLRAHLRAADAGHRRASPGRSRATRSGRSPCWSSRPLPAPPGRARRDRRGHLARRPARGHRQGRRRARDAGPRAGHAVRQDRHAHRRPAAPCARVERRSAATPDEVLRLAASLDQVSPHVLARPSSALPRERGLALPVPDEVAEAPGAGVDGRGRGPPASRVGHGRVRGGGRRAAAVGPRAAPARRARGRDERLRGGRRRAGRRARPRRPGPTRDARAPSASLRRAASRGW